MARLPRGTCPECGESVAVRRNGRLREHRAWPKDGVDRAGWVGKSRHPICPGSGRMPR